MLHRRDFLRGALALTASAAVTLPLTHLAVRPSSATLRRWASGLAESLAAPWLAHGEPPAEVIALRAANPEWDFMARMFLGLALADLALSDPDPRWLLALDRILEHTLRSLHDHGENHFLMSYVHGGTFQQHPKRSLFVDGEVAALIGARRLVSDDPELAALARERLDVVRKRMLSSPVLSAESYPDECWTFCNTFALLAQRYADAVDGTHSELPKHWVSEARKRLVDPQTGLLVSSFTWNGRWLDGPEGSSAWLSACHLRLVDRAFAEDQYTRAVAALSRRFLGFSWASEWPSGTEQRIDVDSGPIVPIVDASPGSSGFALVASRAFGDEAHFDRLCSSVGLAAFPEEHDGGVRFASSNAVGDAVMLYALAQGPLHDRAAKELSA